MAVIQLPPFDDVDYLTTTTSVNSMDFSDGRDTIALGSAAQRDHDEDEDGGDDDVCMNHVAPHNADTRRKNNHTSSVNITNFKLAVHFNLRAAANPM